MLETLLRLTILTATYLSMISCHSLNKLKSQKSLFDTIYVDFEVNKKYLFKEPQEVLSGLSLNGNGATIELYNCADPFILFNIKDKEHLKIKNVKIVGNRSYYRSKNLFPWFPVFYFENCSNITFENVHFKENIASCIMFVNSSNITFKDCTFEDIGMATVNQWTSDKRLIYNYDAVLILALASKYCHNIKIENCSFKNIGVSEFGKHKFNDADGIQIGGSGIIENVEIKNNTFTNIAARAIKYQANGKNIEIKDNKSTNCFAFTAFVCGEVGEKINIQEIKIENNINNNCSISNVGISNETSFLSINGEGLSIKNVEINNNDSKCNLSFIDFASGATGANINIRFNKIDSIQNSFLRAGTIKQLRFVQNICNFNNYRDQVSPIHIAAGDSIDINNNSFSNMNRFQRPIISIEKGKSNKCNSNKYNVPKREQVHQIESIK